MNKLGASTLIKFKNYLKLKNYSERTIDCYSGCLLNFLKHQIRSAVHLSSNDFTLCFPRRKAVSENCCNFSRLGKSWFR